MIDGIGPDKISDITINVIRSQLLDYAEHQCDLHGVPTEQVNGGACWDPERQDWVSRYADLPIYEDERILLVPKASVRYRLPVDHRTYYRKFVIEYLRAEQLSANGSLVKVLKNDKRVVYIKDLTQRYPLSKDRLFSFSQDHPEVLREYRATIQQATDFLTNEEIEEQQAEQREVDYTGLADVLSQIQPGRDDATAYHHHVVGILEALFYPGLHKPRVEQEVNEGRKRIDVVFNNTLKQGFFARLSKGHNIPCPYILVECKNYSEDLANPELDQLIGRFADDRGQLGILVCRSIADRSLMRQRCRDVRNDGKGYVIALDDGDLRHLLELKAAGDEDAIDDYLDNEFRRLVF